ncbi:MAG: Gfo/Idh/MocA family oxidoreductase [Fibrobacteres bacterium]|nr:Gfo/Idh/MocA family oxidoreductase [Fibrobacterota bacterium]
MKKIKAGIVGTGSMGCHHVRVLSSMDGVEVVGVYDSDPVCLEHICKKNNAKAVKSISELLAQKPDTVSIAVPASLHEEVALPFIKAGISILIEKPLANTHETAKRIIESAKKSGARIMVGHIERFNPAIVALKKYVDNKKILSIDITRVGPTPPRIKDVGITIDLGIHDIDLATFLTGKKIVATSCATRSTRGDVHEDISMLLLKLEDGCIAQIHSNWLTPVKTRAIQIATTTEFIKADLIEKSVSIFNRFPDNDDASFSTKLEIEIKEPIRAELESFIHSVRTGEPFAVTAEEGLIALQTATNCLNNSI